MPGFYGRVQDQDGNLVTRPRVYVYDSGTTTAATIYTDTDFVTAMENPFTGDADGSWQFFASAGFYDVHFYKDGQYVSRIEKVSGEVLRDVRDFGDVLTDATAAVTAASSFDGMVWLPAQDGGYTISSPVSNVGAAWLIDPTMTWDEWSDGGNLDIRRGFQTNISPSNPVGSAIWRFADRVFVGDAAARFAGNATVALDGGTSWLSDPDNGPSYLPVNGQLVCITHKGRYAIVGATRASDGQNSVIGIGAVAIADEPAKDAWAFIAELQHEEGANQSLGMEVVAKNKSSTNPTMTPYSGATSGVFGLWFAAGGTSSYGGSPVSPSTAAIVIKNSEHTWNRGIVFEDDSITGTDGSVGSATDGVAIDLGRRQMIRWAEPTNKTTGAYVNSLVTANANRVSLIFNDNRIDLIGPNSVNIFRAQHVASAVNWLVANNSVAGSGPILSCSGSDTDINLWLAPKGAGTLRFGTHTTIGAETVTGYITIRDAAGNLRKLAVVS